MEFQVLRSAVLHTKVKAIHVSILPKPYRAIVDISNFFCSHGSVIHIDQDLHSFNIYIIIRSASLGRRLGFGHRPKASNPPQSYNQQNQLNELHVLHANLSKAILPPLHRLLNNPVDSATFPYRLHIKLHVPSLHSTPSIHATLHIIWTQSDQLSFAVQGLVPFAIRVLLHIWSKVLSELFGLLDWGGP